MKKLEILDLLKHLDGLNPGGTVTVSTSSLSQILRQLLDFENRVQDGAILQEDSGYAILVKYYETCAGVPVPFFGYLWQSESKFYLDRLADEFLEVQPELAGKKLASPTRCAEYILSSKRRLRSFLKWLEREKKQSGEGRRWEIVIFPRIWQVILLKKYGKYGTFLTETWLGPFCLRVWKDPKSIGSISRPVRIGRGWP